MVLEEGEFVGASIPEQFFQWPQACKECRQPADFTVLITGAWGAYRKVPLCKSHWEQTAKKDCSNRPEPLKAVRAGKPGKLVSWPGAKIKHAIIMLTFLAAGAATTASQTGQLAVTAKIESSTVYSQGRDGSWTLTVANGNDAAAMFAPRARKALPLTTASEAADSTRKTATVQPKKGPHRPQKPGSQ